MLQPQNFWLKNENLSKTVPETGWKYWSDNEWKMNDRTLVVTRGPRTLCGSITITGDISGKLPQYSGIFQVMDKMKLGKSVFINDHGMLLYSGFDEDGNNRWTIQEILIIL